MGNTAKQWRLGLFQDSDFAGDLDLTKGTMRTIRYGHTCQISIERYWTESCPYDERQRDHRYVFLRMTVVQLLMTGVTCVVHWFVEKNVIWLTGIWHAISTVAPTNCLLSNHCGNGACVIVSISVLGVVVTVFSHVFGPIFSHVFGLEFSVEIPALVVHHTRAIEDTPLVDRRLWQGFCGCDVHRSASCMICFCALWVPTWSGACAGKAIGFLRTAPLWLERNVGQFSKLVVDVFQLTKPPRLMIALEILWRVPTTLVVHPEHDFGQVRGALPGLDWGARRRVPPGGPIGEFVSGLYVARIRLVYQGVWCTFSFLLRRFHRWGLWRGGLWWDLFSVGHRLRWPPFAKRWGRPLEQCRGKSCCHANTPTHHATLTGLRCWSGSWVKGWVSIGVVRTCDVVRGRFGSRLSFCFFSPTPSPVLSWWLTSTALVFSAGGVEHTRLLVLTTGVVAELSWNWWVWGNSSSWFVLCSVRQPSIASVSSLGCCGVSRSTRAFARLYRCPNYARVPENDGGDLIRVAGKHTTARRCANLSGLLQSRRNGKLFDFESWLF